MFRARRFSRYAKKQNQERIRPNISSNRKLQSMKMIDSSLLEENEEIVNRETSVGNMIHLKTTNPYDKNIAIVKRN